MVMELWKVRIDQYCGFLSDQAAAAEQQQLTTTTTTTTMMMMMITQGFCKEILQRLWQEKC